MRDRESLFEFLIYGAKFEEHGCSCDQSRQSINHWWGDWIITQFIKIPSPED
jgi:hypothetical protein